MGRKKCFTPAIRNLLKITFIVYAIAVGWQPSNAGAGGVRDVVKDLYGGDGITLLDVGGPFSHTAHFTASASGGLDDLNTALISNVGGFAINSIVTGFTFDIERGVPVRTTESLGPFLGERATTLGAGKLNLALTYTRISFKRFEGTSLNDLQLTFLHDDVNGDGVLGPLGTPLDFELDQVQVDLDLKLDQDVLALFATYGVTRNWDVGIVVPIIHTRARADANATIIGKAEFNPDLHQFDPVNQDAPSSKIDREKTGVGDVLLRTKYNFLRKQPGWPDLAAIGQVKFATGDEEDLLGTGETNFLALLVTSWDFDMFNPHVNLGYELSTDSERSNLRYLVGFDVQAHPRLTFAVEGLGRWEPNGDNIGDHLIDLALGAKWNPFGSFIIGTNFLVPLNRDEGLRPNFAWTIGIEQRF
jgi:hypothetical protein